MARPPRRRRVSAACRIRAATPVSFCTVGRWDCGRRPIRIRDVSKHPRVQSENTMSSFITKRRLVGLASASAMIATIAMAAAPAAAMAASCKPTGFVRDGIDLTAAQIGTSVSGSLDATGCDIGVYNPNSVTNADIHGARYYGVVVDGKPVNTVNSNVHGIGEQPFDGSQHGHAILYINGATGSITGNRVSAFQKNGIIVSGQNAAGDGLSGARTAATVRNNVITGRGHIDTIAQNGIVVRDGASATVTSNAIRNLWYTPDTNEATGLLNYNAAKVVVSGNSFVDTEAHVYGSVLTITNVRGSSAILVGAHSVRVDLRSVVQPANTVIGNKLDWKIKVDGRTVMHVKEGFAAHDVYRQQFAAHSGRHIIKVFKNDVLVRTATVRS